MRRRHIVLLVSLLLVGGALTALIWLRQRTAPYPVRLLPEADAVVYADLRPLRLVANLSQQPAVEREPDYAAFVQATGFEFERDLDQAAVAVHQNSVPPDRRPADDNGTRFSEVFVARFDSTRLATYLKGLAQRVEHFGEDDIYEIPHEGRTVRVAILGVDSVAVSNVEDASVIRGMIERSRQLGLPQRGPVLVQEYWKEIPRGSLAWAIANIPSNDSRSADMSSMLAQLGGGFTLVASVRPGTSGADVRAVAVAPNEEAARTLTENVGTLLALFRTIEGESHPGGGDPDVKALVNSIEVAQQGNRAVLSASAPYPFLRKAVSQSPAAAMPPAPAEAARPNEKSQKMRSQKK